MSQSPAAKIETAERRARVIELRRQGLTFAEIGRECGFSTQRAHEVYLEALKAIPAREVDQYRAEAIELAHAAIERLLEIATDGRQPRTSVEAWNSIRAWSERVAKIVGFDASTKIEANITPAQVEPELIAMIRDAHARADAEQAALAAEDVSSREYD